MQTGTYVSPGMYRKLIKPRQRKLFDFIHSKTHAKIFYHSCGSVYDIIPDLIEIGVDALNPVQRSAARMDIVTLKKEFGQDISFWGGGVDIQQFLPFASLEEIEEEVKRTMDIMAPGGGFVFVPSHNIQADVTPDRIDAMYQAALKYRDYGK
jgi:uroporphyrinogen decarboxylase